MSDVVELGERGLAGEVVAIRGDVTTVQAYEYTGGLAPGDPARSLGVPLSARLGPHLLGGVFDGLLRPLTGAPAWLEPGRSRESATGQEFGFTPEVAVGAAVGDGTCLGSVAVAGGIGYRVLAPPGLSGTVEEARPAGLAAGDSVIAVVSGVAVRLTSDWPVRRPRPYQRRLDGAAPLLTGQRVVDVLFPVTRGGATAVPGGFGTGKTVLLQQIAKWCDADVIVYVGCGERGNELADLLAELAELTDPRSGGRLAERTVVIANTSNMPMMAREASIYSGATVAEYFRDMGLDTVVIADSTSRWAEALREFASRSGELPAEEGYPASLVLGPGRVLRAGRPRGHQRGPRGLGDDHRRGLPGGRRHDRAGHHVHAAVRPVPVVPGPRPRLRPALPGGLLVRIVLPRRRRRRRLACRQRRSRLGGPPGPARRAARGGRPAQLAGRADGRQRPAARRAGHDPGRAADPGRRPAAERAEPRRRILRQRPGGRAGRARCWRSRTAARPWPAGAFPPP